MMSYKPGVAVRVVAGAHAGKEGTYIGRDATRGRPLVCVGGKTFRCESRSLLPMCIFDDEIPEEGIVGDDIARTIISHVATVHGIDGDNVHIKYAVDGTMDVISANSIEFRGTPEIMAARALLAMRTNARGARIVV